MSSLEDLQGILNYNFTDPNLLRQALVHRSYLNENPSFALSHNERLEYLGDAVLELIVSQYLYHHYPNPEGDLTNWRASLVNAKNLSEVAKDLELDQWLMMSRGEAKDKDSKARQNILANAIEAVIGAVYLDGGLAAAEDLVTKQVLSKLPDILHHRLYIDPKSRFQEMSQEIIGLTPTYRVLKEWGPDHGKQFRVGLYLGQEEVAQGEGTSKQEAQVDAATNGLKVKGW